MRIANRLTLGLILLSSAIAQANPIVYLDETVGQAFQEAEEQRFLSNIADEVLIDFDNAPAGPVSGNEWSSSGVAFAQPDGGQLELIQVGFSVPHSSPNYLHPLSSFGSERVEISLLSPTHAVGFWLIDSEFQSPTGDTIKFYDSDDALLLSFAMPVAGFSAADASTNFFVGLVSETPIARIEINEYAGDGEDIAIDDVWLGVPEPTSLSLSGLGVLALARRKLYI